MIKLGIVGRNINHSLSPKIHEFAMRSFGVEGTYSLFDIQDNDLDSFLSRSWEEGVLGLNITAPYKKRVSEFLGCRDIPSVNLLSRGGGFWKAHSSDAMGLFRGLKRMNCKVELCSRVIILGNGGVLPAILSGFTGSMHKVYILCRQARHESALREYNPNLHWLPWEPVALQELLSESDEKTLLIQATSAPLHGDALQSFADAMGGLNGYFVDLVYGKPSQLYHFALQNKMPCQDGLPMLIEQARVSQECWFGQSLGYESLWSLLTNKTHGADGRN